MSLLFADSEPFRLVYADPPWLYDNYGQRGHGAARSVYPKNEDGGDGLLTDEDIAALPVGRITAENAVCVLWVTRPVLAEGRGAAVLRAWGFRPVTTACVWVKVYADGSPYCGLGHYTRSGTEVALLGIRGSCPRAELATKVYEVAAAPLQDLAIGEHGETETHSSKPEVFLERVEELWPHLTPRVELFARRRRPGWHAWGAEAPACDLVFGPEVGRVWTPRPVCTGVAAKWCPVHGDCSCREELFGLNDERCSLHAGDSGHAERLR